MINFNILVADSGATKTEWAWASPEGFRVVSTEGVNPIFLERNEIEAIAKRADEQLEMHFDEIFFYCAGCIDEAHCQKVSNAISKVFSCDNVHVQSDLLGAARALCGHGKGVAAILGTGSNSCCFNGTCTVRNVKPLGYILGDEGSGAHIGRQLVADCLKGILPESVCQKMMKWCGMSYSEIIESVYQKPLANRFLARFAIFAHDNIDIPEVEQIVRKCFAEFADRCLPFYECLPEHPVNFAGSVAAGFEPILRDVITGKGYKVGVVVRRPVERLVEYHCNLRIAQISEKE